MTMNAPSAAGRLERGRQFRIALPHFSLGLVAVTVTAMFIWSVWAFAGAILWSVVAAIMFLPLNDRLLKVFPGQRTVAAILTLIIVIAMGVLPGVALFMFMLDQVGSLYAEVQSGRIDIPATFERVQAVLPSWILAAMHRTGVTDLASLREQLSIGLTARLQMLALHAMAIGQGVASFLLSLATMLYLTFFLVRDGRSMATAIASTVPLAVDDR